MNLHIYSNFHPNERPFVDKAMEWAANASQLHAVKLTDFLDPRQCFIVKTLANREKDVNLLFNGGYGGAERQRALIAPSYKALETEELNIKVLSITSNDPKVSALDHSDYMGAILNLGVKRDKVGDLFVSGQGCHCLI
ncbi:MAG TPA: YlmH/Sll1252 family protein, partial [Bacilli bacterium]